MQAGDLFRFPRGGRPDSPPWRTRPKIVALPTDRKRMPERTLRGKTAIAGIGETTYYKHGQSPDSEFKLALEAIVKACEDAGIGPHDVDGFASYGNDRSA